jgi:hypothetical protein
MFDLVKLRELFTTKMTSYRLTDTTIEFYFYNYYKNTGKNYYFKTKI